MLYCKVGLKVGTLNYWVLKPCKIPVYSPVVFSSVQNSFRHRLYLFYALYKTYQEVSGPGQWSFSWHHCVVWVSSTINWDNCSAYRPLPRLSRTAYFSHRGCHGWRWLTFIFRHFHYTEARPSPEGKMISSQKIVHIGIYSSWQRRGSDLYDPWNANQDGHRRCQLFVSTSSTCSVCCKCASNTSKWSSEIAKSCCFCSLIDPLSEIRMLLMLWWVCPLRQRSGASILIVPQWIPEQSNNAWHFSRKPQMHPREIQTTGIPYSARISQFDSFG